ncbi:MAG: DNA internalization-related competence protein ComEC/Rec2 [Desulfobacteraceae bacterium]|jgi:competence protein ComEC
MNTPTYFSRPVIPLLLCLMIGIVTGHLLPGHFHIPLLILVVCFFLIIRAIWRKKPLTLIPLLLFAATGNLSIQEPSGKAEILASSAHVRFYAGKGEFTVSGRVKTVPEVEKRDRTFILDRISVFTKDGERRGVRGTLKARTALVNGEYAKGDLLEITGKIKEFHNFNNPNGFDYREFMERDDVWGNIYGKKGNTTLVEKGRPTALDRMRSAVEALIDKTSASKPGKEVLKALITGSRQGIDSQLQDDFCRTGTVHLLSISGLHVGVVAGFFFFLFRFVLSYITPLLWQGRVKALAGVLTLVPVWVYGFLSGMPPATQRSVIMATVFLLTYGFEAEHEIVNTLALAAMVILSISPHSLFNISFQLSFGSVLSIIWGISAMNHRKQQVDDMEQAGDRTRRLIQSIQAYILVSVFAFVGTWPLVAYYFNQVSVIGFVANPVLVPFVGMLVVILGLGAVFIFPLGIHPALWILEAAGFILDKSMELIRFFSSLPWASFKIVTPSILELVCYYIVLICLIEIKRSEKTNRKKRMALASIVSIVVMIMVFDGVYWLNKRFHHRDMRVTYIDVGQGSSALVEFPDGECMLVDGGGFSDNEMFDVGEKIVAPLLWSKKIGHVDRVVLSHPESDHLNGLLYILEHFTVNELWTNGIETDTKGFRRMMELAEMNHTTVKNRKDLQDKYQIGGVNLRIFWPLKNDETTVAFSAKQSNNMSIVLKMTFGRQSFLFPGDILEQAEADMINTLADARDLKSRVLLVPHHGSKSSSSDLFIQTVAPDCAVVSAGYKNWFKFPHPMVLERLAVQGSTVYRTDSHGAVVMTTKGDDLKIETGVNGDGKRDQIADPGT